jgi:hypothetical protein
VDTFTSEEKVARSKLDAISIPPINSSKSVRLKIFKRIQIPKNHSLKKKV